MAEALEKEIAAMAEALEKEIAARKKAEDALQKAQEDCIEQAAHIVNLENRIKRIEYAAWLTERRHLFHSNKCCGAGWLLSRV